MEQNIMPLKKGEIKKTDEYTIMIDNNIFHVISKFQGTETSSRIIYNLAVKRILYDEP